MKRLRNIPAVVLPMLFLALIDPGLAPCAAPTPDGEAAVQAVNAFAVDLYGQIRKSEGNLIFSPYSVSMALVMAYAGARGRTESQIAKALHLSLPQPKVIKAFAAVNAQVIAAGRGKTAEINVANAMWAGKSYPLLNDYLESVRMNYQGGLRQLDFRHGPDAARKTVNIWVKEQTKDKIKDLLAPGTITGDTRLVLTNAIYFKGKWASQFNKEWTREDLFTLLDGKDVRVPMMHHTESLGYTKEAELQVLEMPYRGGELSMVVLLPSKQKRLEDFERSITLDQLRQWIGKLKMQKVVVFLPRFEITSEFPLRTALTGLGMTDAFSMTNADFSGMTGKRDLFIEEGIHKALVETNEEGTEAVAATGMRPTRALLPVFRADHPFVFLIWHKPSRCILFLGRVTNPLLPQHRAALPPETLPKADDSNSELLDAASGGDISRVVRALDQGANIETKNEAGATPLMWAAVNGHVAVASLLIQRGANVNSRTASGATALKGAASQGHLEIIRMLVRAGADLSAKDNQGQTALDAARAEGQNEIMTFLSNSMQQSTSTPSCTVDYNVDRPGGDYSQFDLQNGDFRACQDACAKDPKCKAYAVRKPGSVGPSARCYLKSTVPTPQETDCCVSGVKNP